MSNSYFHEDSLGKIKYPESFGGSDLTFDPSFKVQWGHLYFEYSVSPFLLVLGVLDLKTIYKKSFALNLFVGSDLTSGADPSFK